MRVSAYRRRQPEATLLYNVIRENLNTFLEFADSRSGGPLPKYVRQEFFRYLDCGILAHGFARVHCDECGYDTVVGFSCKGRGFCPSCCGRRMAETAANLVDHVFPPQVPVRQWVLSVPRQIRYYLMRDAKLLSGALRIFIEEVFRHLSRQYAFLKLGVDGRRHRWRYRQRLPEAREAKCGGVTSIQRFGSSLNAHVHFHSLLLDGVYVRDPDTGELVFIRVPEPDREDMEIILARVIRRVIRYLTKHGCFVEDSGGEPAALETLQAASIAGLESLSTMPRRVQILGRRASARFPRDPDRPFTAERDGWSIHAGVLIEAGEKEQLEKACRYLLRPPFAEERLSRLPDGRIFYGFRKPRWDGGTGMVLDPVDFLAKLASLVPPPRANLVRYHGVLGPNCKVRREIVPPPPASEPETCVKSHGELDSADDNDDSEAPSRKGRRRRGRSSRIDWATLLRRTLGLDALACPRCDARMRVLACITEPDVIRKILVAMKLSTEIPRLLPSRDSPQGSFEFDQIEGRVTA